MTLITPEERVSRTADLLRSVQDSIQQLRQMAEDLKRQLEAGEDVDLSTGKKQVDELGRLIRSCQTVEERFVEQHHRQAGIVRGGYALDLDRARIEVGCRLARLRTCCDPGSIPD
jgi:hypothetical protein